jgi:hypothetical protein
MVLHKNCNLVIGRDFSTVLNGKQISTNNWYLDKEQCEYHNILNNTIYTWWRFHNGLLEFKEVLHRDCIRDIGTNFIKVVTGERAFTNGWYIDKEQCVSTYAVDNILYSWNTLSREKLN